MGTPMSHDAEPEINHNFKEIPYGPLSPEMLEAWYRKGTFVMSDIDEDGPVMFTGCYDPRGVIPLDTFKVPHGTRALIRNNPYHITVDQDFEAVMRGCAESKPGREGTWINEHIIDAYTALHKQGKAHSVEIRDADNTLVGGLYGVSLGGAFCGESMFSHVPGASKIALVHLAETLKKAGYTLLDIQEVGSLTQQFGGISIPLERYKEQLAQSLALQPDPSQKFKDASKEIQEITPAQQGRISF